MDGWQVLSLEDDPLVGPLYQPARLRLLGLSCGAIEIVAVVPFKAERAPVPRRVSLLTAITTAEARKNGHPLKRIVTKDDRSF